MSSQFQRHIKCWQCSYPGQLHASTTSPLSPTLTLMSIYLRAGPVSKVRLMCLVPTFASCAVVLSHIIMCFYSASTQNVTLCQLTDSFFYLFISFLCWCGTALVPRWLCASHIKLRTEQMSLLTFNCSDYVNKSLTPEKVTPKTDWCATDD